MQIDIIRLILLKLKVKALIRCQCVCKEWRSTIQDPDFQLSYRGSRRVLTAVASRSGLTFTSITECLRIKTLFQVSENRSFVSENRSFTPLYSWWSGVWCSCNGLVLFSVLKHIFLWNPSTRCCTKVLELPRLSNTIHSAQVVSGLCYILSTGDYKAVLIFGFGHDRIAMVASLKNKGWKNVSFPNYELYSVGNGINFNNTPHWRANGSGIGRCEKIIYFEGESDEFKELPTPELCGRESVVLGLGIIDGCLCMIHEGKEIGKNNVLVMKEYGVKKSWVSQFVISITLPLPMNYSIYSSKCNTKVLICSCLRFLGPLEILVYDVRNNKMDNYFLEQSKHIRQFVICSYVQSIVSPHEFIWRDDQHKPPENDSVLSFILEKFNV
nr:F-box/kelch-repeat protein At3g23880-like [Ipomoea batatas]